jgi:hypothetical protein
MVEYSAENVRIPTIAPSRSDGSRPPGPIDRAQCGGCGQAPSGAFAISALRFVVKRQARGADDFLALPD